MTFEGVPDHPEGFVYLRLDKNNYRQIIAAIEGETGMTVERVEEEQVVVGAATVLNVRAPREVGVPRPSHWMWEIAEAPRVLAVMV